MWGVWAAMSVAAIGLSFTWGFPIPYWDDWGDMVPLYTGKLPLSVGSLWQPHNEHHIPLSRLILIGLGRATNHDLRAGAVFSAVLLSAASALLLRSARRVDGRLRLADCALPLLFLHWGQCMTLLWSYQVHAALLALFSSALLAILAFGSELPSARLTIAFGLGLLSLPLCQAGGIALAPVLAVWCGIVGVLGLRSAESRRHRTGMVALALAAAAIALAACAYVSPRFRPAADLLRVPWWSAVMISTAFGVTDRGPPATVLLPALTVALLLSTGALLLRVWFGRPGERLRVLGFGLFLLAFLALSIGIALRRHESSLSNRYPVLAAPMMCALYLVWRRYGPGRPGALVCAATCALLLLLTPWNTTTALRFARRQAETSAAFERDARADVPISELVTRYAPALTDRTHTLRKGLIDMKFAQVGVFRPDSP